MDLDSFTSFSSASLEGTAYIDEAELCEKAQVPERRRGEYSFLVVDMMNFQLSGEVSLFVMLLWLRNPKHHSMHHIETVAAQQSLERRKVLSSWS